MWRLIFFSFLLPLSVSAQLKRFQFTQNKMGSPFNIIFYHTDSVEATIFAKECYLLIDSLNNIFSDYITTSEVGMLADNATNENKKVSDELFAMLLRSKEAWIKSKKTFDITIGPLSQIWRKAKSEKRFPADTEIKKAKQATGFKNVGINLSDKTISFKKPGMRFDFGGIVKGYAAQKVIDHLKSKNIKSALADAGGDIVMSDSPPEKNGWTIGINLPEQENELWDQKLELKNCSVATSGDVYRYTLHNGKKYSHIIDPRTGYGVTTQRNVTVIAKNGATADWLATACSILPIKKAMRLAKKENAALLIAVLKDEKIILNKSENFDQYFQKKEP
jgi:thiamine biosynthesis lipoprotein